MGQFADRLKKGMRLARREKRGGLKDIEKRLGHAPGYFSSLALKGERLLVTDFEGNAAAMGFDACALARRVLDPCDLEGLLATLAAPRNCNIVRALRGTIVAVRRGAEQPSDDEEMAPEEVAALAAGLCEGEAETKVEWLRSDPRYRNPQVVLASAQALDRHRQANPLATARLARTLAVEVCPHLRGEGAVPAFSRAAGALASAYRVTGEHALAAAVLEVPLPLVLSVGARPAQADLYQRATYVFLDHLRLEEALTLAKQAGQLYFELVDWVGMGQSLTDRGIVQHRMGDLLAAQASLDFALAILPEPEQLNRMATYFHLARVWREQGEPGKAAACFQKAEGLLGPGHPYNRGCLLYEQGKTLREAGQGGEAALCFRQARDLAREVNPFEAAFVGLDLVRTLLELSRATEAAVETRAMAALVQPLAKHPVAAAILKDLVQVAARVSLQDIARAQRDLEKARPRAGGPLPAA